MEVSKMKTTKITILGLFVTAVFTVFCGENVYSQMRLVPGDAAVARAATEQSAPAIASGAKSTLAVWGDFRANPYGSYDYETSRDIYGMRFDSAGVPLDALPRLIVGTRANQNYPKVAWNGANWLVVYQSVDVGGTGYYQNSLEAVRVAPDGQVLDAEPIKLLGLIPSGPSYWSLASDGNNWVVVNQSTPTSGDIVAVRVSPDGALLDPPNRSLVSSTYYMRSNIQVAYAGGVFLATFNDAYNNGTTDTKAVRFDSNLNRLDAAPISFLPTTLSALTANGSGFFAVWHRQETDYSVHVVGSRINTTGARLDGNGVNISGTRQPYAYTVTAAAWDGINWRVTFGEYGAAFVARINSAGTVLDPGGVAVPGIQTGPTAGTGTGALQVAWTEYANGDNDVFSANISTLSAAGTKREMSVGAPQQTRPDVAASGNGYMVVYRSTNSINSRILAQPLDAAGNPLAAEPVQLETGAAFNGPGSPNVAWNGALYLVSWGTTSGIVAQRLSPDGTKIDASPFLVMASAFGAADVAALGSDFLVTGRKISGYPQYIVPVATRVSGAGAVLDSSPKVLGFSYLRTAPAVVALGGRWLVAWHRNATHDDSYCVSAGAFVEANGTVNPEFGIHGPFSTAGGNGIFEVGLASNGTTALFVQSQELTSGVENDMLARTIGANGTVGAAVNLTPWAGNQYRPRVAWDGSSFVIVYQEQKNRLALNTLDQLDARSDLYAMRVSAAGVKLDPQGYVFSAFRGGETDPAVAASNGSIFLAGALMKNDAPFDNYRIAYEIVPGNRPVATINASATEGDIPLTVLFDSGGFGAPVSYAWDFGDGGVSTTPNTSHVFTVAGEYLVTLTVTDEFGRQTKQAQMINAMKPNLVPIAIGTSNRYSGSAPLDVVLSAASSYDPDGVIGNVDWRFSDGGYTYGATAYHTFQSTGLHTVTLLCYDARGGIGTTSFTVNVGGVNQPPIAQASASPASGSAPLIVQFSSAGSRDPDGMIVEYQWIFGDAFGVISREPNPLYTYSYPGSYTATLTVWDNNNVSRSASVVVNVSPSPTTVLRSTAVDLSSVLQGKRVAVTGNVIVKDLSGATVSGAVVYVTWRKPGFGIVTQSSATNANGVARFTTTGSRGIYTLTVTDVTKDQYTFDAAGSVVSASIRR
jgi:PKD repeat protein